MKCMALQFLRLTLLALLVTSETARGQTITGSIDVTVKDAAGAAVPGAEVKCTNKNTGLSRTCFTDTDGFCLVKELPVGPYLVKVSAPNFATAESNADVTANYETPISATLSPQGVPETVTVEATSSLVESRETTVTSIVSEKQITELPLNNRIFLQLASLSPGVASDPGSGGAPAGAFGSFSVNGSSSRSNTFVVDGLDVSDGYRNTININEPSTAGTSRAVLPAEAVQEFTLATNGMANVGRGTGAIVNITVRSGGKEFHGSGFGFFSHEALGARNFFNSVGRKNKDRFGDFGFRASGPMTRDREKAFFFFLYEGLRTSNEATTFSAVPTQSDFNRAIIALGGNPAVPPQNNAVVNPVIRNLFALCRNSGGCPGGTDLWPQPSESRQGQVLNALGIAPTSSNSDNVVVKLDWNINDRNRLNGHFSYGSTTQNLPLALGGGDDLPQTNSMAPSNNKTATLSYLFFPSNLQSNELRIGWNRYARDFLDEDAAGVGNPAQTIGLNTGIPNARDFGLPHIIVRDFSSLGATPYSNPHGRTNQTWQITDTFGWILGRNDMKFGYEFRHTTVDSFNDVNFRGKLEFASLIDFLAGNIRSGSILRGDSNRTTVRNTHALFFHDLFRFGPRLSLNFGARWDYYGAFREKNNLFSKYDPNAGLVLSEQLYSPDITNIGPRFGFAWDLNGQQKIVLRGSTGIYFDSFSQDVLLGQIQFRTFNAGVAYNPISPSPILTSRSPVASIQPGIPVFPAQTFISDSRDVTTLERIRTPFQINYNINLQRELAKLTVLQIGYFGSRGYRLLRTRDVNAPPIPGASRPLANAAVLSSVAPNRPFVVNQIENSASSNYNSLQVSFRRSKAHGVSTTVNWTWSHFIDTASDAIDSTPNISSPDNPNAPSNERANSSFDIRHRLVWSFLYDFEQFNQLLSPRLKGWNVAAILTLSSGTPYHLNYGDEFDTLGFYDFILRSDVVGDPLFGTSTPDRLVNLAALKVPCTLDGAGTEVSNCLPGTLHFGNLPRNAFRSPSYGNLDYSISKTTAINERVSLQLRVDVFNGTNHPSFLSPLLPRFIARASAKGIDLTGRGGARGTGCNTALASDDCYLPATRASRPRTIQFSARLMF